jgi:hypothetical protein
MTGTPNSTRPFVALNSKHSEEVGGLTVMTLRLDVRSGDRSLFTDTDSFTVERIETTLYYNADDPGDLGDNDYWLTTAIGEGKVHHLTAPPSEWVEDGLAPEWFTAAVTDFAAMARTRR